MWPAVIRFAQLLYRSLEIKVFRGLYVAGFAIVAILTSHVGLAQVVPYRVAGTGELNPSTGEFSGPSIGLHLGRFTYSGQVTSQDPTDNPLVFNWTAVDTQVAANGDQIALTGTGTLTLIPIAPPIFGAEWEGQWTVTGGTGRFGNIQSVGPIRMTAVNDPFDATDLVTPRRFRYEKVGRINLGRR